MSKSKVKVEVGAFDAVDGEDEDARQSAHRDKERERARQGRGHGDGDFVRQQQRGHRDRNGERARDNQDIRDRHGDRGRNHERHGDRGRDGGIDMQPNRDRYGDRDRQSRRQRDRDEGDEDDDGARSKRPKPDPKPDPKPEWETSGALAEETNTYKGRQLKWNEPPDLHKPKEKYRLYMFKDGEQEKEPYLLRNAAYMVGRDRSICDIPAYHPSLSEQHAIICYRLVHYKVQDDNGLSVSKRKLRPYIMDLESTNGTKVNERRIPPARYYELHHKDSIQFGSSTRSYILLKEETDD